MPRPTERSIGVARPHPRGWILKVLANCMDHYPRLKARIELHFDEIVSALGGRGCPLWAQGTFWPLCVLVRPPGISRRGSNEN
jgi:hypothetical protein